MRGWLRPLLLGMAAALSIQAASVSARASASGPSEDASPDARVVVRIVDDEYVPATVEIHRGQTVVWKNVSLATHTVTCDPGAARFPEHASLPGDARPFDSGPLGLGASYAHTFDIPGVYRYFCLFHEAERMVGTVVVKP